MKHLKHIVLIGVLSMLFTPMISAQNIDANRMNRDIRIMENILAELFRTQVEVATGASLIIDHGGTRQRDIRGTYLQDFGIIFMIPANDPFTPRMHVTGGNGYSFYYSTDSNNDDDNAKREVDEGAVQERISEFLLDYASTIGQLDDDETIMVIHGSTSSNQRTYWNYRIAVNGETTEYEQEAMPVISATARMKDLKDYRSGRIDAAEAKQRINFATSEDKEYLDLKVLGNIFETALRDAGENEFRISGGIGYMMLDNFGAIFNFDARYGGGRDIFFGRLAETQRRLRIIQEQEIRTGRRVEGLEEEAVAIEQRQEQLKEEMIVAFGNLKTSISEYLVDYGRTLSSVDSDQFILTSVNISTGGIDEIPERIDLQIKKSVLENLDRGRISRDEAINSVLITEY